MDDNRKVIKIAVPARGVEAYQDGFERKAPPEAPKPAPKPLMDSTDEFAGKATTT